ncbi:MAG: HAMP domain-containing histidine kinase [Anaerolineales bacterium]|nr:HAMP domain-containing histidine kinase [Anaerolineales bacterium]
MFTSLRSRLWLSYAFLIVTALSVVTIVLFISLYRNPFLYRQTTEQLKAVQTILLQRSQEPQSLPLDVIAERSAQTFNVRVILFNVDRSVRFDSGSNEPALEFPAKRLALFRKIPLLRDANGKAWLYSIEKLPEGTFAMVVAPRPQFSILNIFNDEFMPVIILGGVTALILSLVVAFLITGWIANPLQSIVNAARKMPSTEIQPVAEAGPREVQELTRSFNSMQARVQMSQQSQREFVANVSHEMKTPLTSIQGFAQSLLDGTAEDSASRQRAAQVIYNEAGRMHRMVLDLLDLAKLDAGTADLKMAFMDVGTLLRAIAEKFLPQSQRAGVNIELDIAPNLPLLFADGDRMAQVFTNLVDNALKFTPQGGRVTLTASTVRDEFCITVTDTGMGISEEELPHVFQRFYQADPARKGGETHGAGLGLAIAHEIVMAHGGRISVRSSKDSGTSFDVALPLK